MKTHFEGPNEVTFYIRYTLIDNCIHRILSEQYLKMSRNKKMYPLRTSCSFCDISKLGLLVVVFLVLTLWRESVFRDRARNSA